MPIGSLGAKEVNSLDSIGRTSYSAGKMISSPRQEVRMLRIRQLEIIYILFFNNIDNIARQSTPCRAQGIYQYVIEMVHL